MAMLLLVVVFLYNAFLPSAILLFPDELLRNDLAPIAVFFRTITISVKT